jgi:hypothetical protein
MSINNREDANRYYQLINDLVDDYTEKWKIKPSNLKKYLRPGSEKFNRFLERNKLKDIKGCDRILKDVIEDRYSLEKDGVLTFENYKFFESNDFKIPSMKECFYKGIDKANQSMEKILADYFDTNLSDIDIVDASKHLFKINDWNNDDLSVIIYSEEEFDIIKSNITEHLLDELEDREVELSNGLNIKLKDIISKDTYEKKMRELLTDNFCIKLLEDLFEHKYKSNTQSHYVFIM